MEINPPCVVPAKCNSLALRGDVFEFLHIFRVDALFLKYQCTDTVPLISYFTPALYMDAFILNSKKTYCSGTLLLGRNIIYSLGSADDKLARIFYSCVQSFIIDFTISSF